MAAEIPKSAAGLPKAGAFFWSNPDNRAKSSVNERFGLLETIGPK